MVKTAPSLDRSLQTITARRKTNTSQHAGDVRYWKPSGCMGKQQNVLSDLTLPKVPNLASRNIGNFSAAKEGLSCGCFGWLLCLSILNVLLFTYYL